MILKDELNFPGVLYEENKDLKKFSTMRLNARGNLIQSHQLKH